jgi:hypothetical protein
MRGRKLTATNLLFIAIVLAVPFSGGILADDHLAIFLPVAAAVLLILALTWMSLGAERFAYVSVAAFVLVVNWNGIRLPHGAAVDAVMALAGAAVALLVVVDRRAVPLPGWLLLAGGGLFIAGLVTLSFPPRPGLVTGTAFIYVLADPARLVLPHSNVLALLKLELVWLVIPPMLAIIATDRTRCVTLLDVWALSTVVSAAVGIVDIAGIHLAPNPIQGHRSSGLTLQPNYLGLGCAMGLPATLLWVGRSARWTIAGWAGVGILLGGVLVSGSRAGAAGALLAIAFTALAVPPLRSRTALLFPVCGMAMILLLMLTTVGHQILHQTRISTPLATYQSDAGRSQLHQVAISQFGARPLSGVGFGVVEDAHDIYLQLLAAGGVIALASFVVYLWGLAGAARHCFGGTLRNEAAGASVAIVVWLMSGPFENQLADKFLYILPGLLYAMSVVARKEAAGWAPNTSLSDQVHLRTDQPQRNHHRLGSIRGSRSRTSSPA